MRRLESAESTGSVIEALVIFEPALGVRPLVVQLFGKAKGKRGRTFRRTSLIRKIFTQSVNMSKKNAHHR